MASKSVNFLGDSFCLGFKDVDVSQGVKINFHGMNDITVSFPMNDDTITVLTTNLSPLIGNHTNHGELHNASQFAFVNPVTEHNIKQVLDNSSYTEILKNGGFLYANANLDPKHILAVSNDKPSVILTFDFAGELPESAVSELKSSGRWQLVTVPFLKELGATHFCWINPHEFVNTKSGAYCYGFQRKEDSTMRYCYYAMR